MKYKLSFRGPSLSLALLFLISAFGLLPIVTVVLFSFHAGTIARFPIESYSTKWYVEIASNQEIRQSFLNSLCVAASVAFISTVLGCLAAPAMRRPQWLPIWLYTSLICVPFLIPTQVSAIAITAYFQYLGIAKGFIAVVCAQTCYTIPLAAIITVLGYEHVDLDTLSASRNLGATRGQTFFYVTLPQLTPSLFAASIMSFLVSWDEGVLSWHLGGYYKTMPALIVGKLGGIWEPSLYAVGTFSFLISCLLFFVSFLTIRRSVAANRNGS